MPRRYPRHFRRDRVNQTLAGESVLSWVQETSVPERTLHRWRQPALIDQGPVGGRNSEESAQLRAGNKHFSALEMEL